MELNFVPTQEEDRAFFIHAHHAAYRQLIGAAYGWDEALQDKFAHEAFDEGNSCVIWFKSSKAGIVCWQTDVDHLQLKEIFLLPEQQSKGIGSEVLRISKEKASTAGIPLRLKVRKTNTGAKKLYERCGLHAIGETDTHWQMEWNPSK